MNTTTYGNCLLFHGGGLCPVSNQYLSALAEELEKEEIFERIFMGFFSFECLLNPEELIKPWTSSLKAKAEKSPGGFYGTSRNIDLTVPELQSQAIATCKDLSITWIGVAGGDGSCRQVAEISEAFEAEGIHLFIPMPLTIDGIEGGYSLGLQSAVMKSLDVLDDLAATNLQTRDNREFSALFLELQGRNRDDILANLLHYIVRVGDFACGGIPHNDIDLFVVPANYYWNLDKLITAVNNSKKRTLVIYSEGANVPIDYIMEKVKRKIRVSKVGYLSQMNKVKMHNIGQYVPASIIKSAISDGRSFSLKFNEFSSATIEPIDYWAKLNPREEQKPTLNPDLEKLLKEYTPQ